MGDGRKMIKNLWMDGADEYGRNYDPPRWISTHATAAADEIYIYSFSFLSRSSFVVSWPCVHNDTVADYFHVDDVSSDSCNYPPVIHHALTLHANQYANESLPSQQLPVRTTQFDWITPDMKIYEILCNLQPINKRPSDWFLLNDTEQAAARCDFNRRWVYHTQFV